MKTFLVSIGCGVCYLCGVGVLASRVFFIAYLVMVCATCLLVDD